MKIEDKHIPTKTIKLSLKGKRVFPVDTKTLEKIKKKHSLSKTANTTGDFFSNIFRKKNIPPHPIKVKWSVPYQFSLT
jgi:hypothetical protein